MFLRGLGIAGRGSVIVTLSKKGIGQSCLECQELVFIGGNMTQIFDLVRQGYRCKLSLGIFFEFSEQHDGYLLIFRNRPRLIWTVLSQNSDDIPF